MNRAKLTLLTAGTVLAMAFTVSCSSDDNNGGGGGGGYPICKYKQDGVETCWQVKKMGSATVEYGKAQCDAVSGQFTSDGSCSTSNALKCSLKDPGTEAETEIFLYGLPAGVTCQDAGLDEPS